MNTNGLSLPSNNENLVSRKQRNKRLKKTDAEFIQLFWNSPNEAFFGQEVVSPVINISAKTLEWNRWQHKGIPYRKCGGRVLYRKSDVIAWVEAHELVSSA